jgi:hypothetical protein
MIKPNLGILNDALCKEQNKQFKKRLMKVKSSIAMNAFNTFNILSFSKPKKNIIEQQKININQSKNFSRI